MRFLIIAAGVAAIATFAHAKSLCDITFDSIRTASGGFTSVLLVNGVEPEYYNCWGIRRAAITAECRPTCEVLRQEGEGSTFSGQERD